MGSIRGAFALLDLGVAPAASADKGVMFVAVVVSVASFASVAGEIDVVRSDAECVCSSGVVWRVDRLRARRQWQVVHSGFLGRRTRVRDILY